MAATLIVCNWHCECSACGWGTHQGFTKVEPALWGDGGSFTFWDAPDEVAAPGGGMMPNPGPLGPRDTSCPRCGEEFIKRERLMTS